MNRMRLGDPQAFATARRIIRDGGIIAYPTDTTYALGVDARNIAAVRRLQALKGRDADKPISIAVADVADVADIAALTEKTRPFVARMLPGALTLILPARGGFPSPIVNAEGSVGVRVPGSPLCRDLLSEIGVAITTTSANPGGSSAALKVEDFDAFPAGFTEGLDLLLEAGPTDRQAPSTVIDLSGGELRLVREGAAPFAEIKRRISDL